MVSRRDFLSLSAAVSAGSVLTASGATGVDAQAGAALPPSIAELTSMKGEAKPITTAERQARVDRARALMTRHKLDAIVLAGGTSTVYFTNVNWWLSERFFGIFLTAKGDHFVVCPHFEEERAREQLDGGPLKGTPVLTWHEHEDPYALSAKGLKDRGIATGRVGIEETYGSSSPTVSRTPRRQPRA